MNKEKTDKKTKKMLIDCINSEIKKERKIIKFFYSICKDEGQKKDLK